MRQGRGLMADANQDRRPLPRILHGVAWSLLLLMAGSLMLNLYWRRFPELRCFPYDIPFLPQSFPDFLSFQGRFDFFGTPEFFSYPSESPFMYPAATAVVYKALYLAPWHPLLTFLLMGLLAFSVAAVLFGRALVRLGITRVDAFLFPFAILLCSYPFWFAGRQANMEIVMWVVAAMGLGCFLTGRGYLAGVCFGIAAALKIYPLVYVGLLLARRQYRQAAVSVGTLVLVTVGSLRMMSPKLLDSWRGINAGLEQFRVEYVLGKRVEIGLDHSLFACLKRLLQPYPDAGTMAHILSAYLGIAAIGGVVVFAFRIRGLPLLNQILCLTIASILFPPVSFEYTLLHLLLPFALYVLLMVDARREGRKAPGERFVLGSFVVLLGFLPDLIHHGTQFGGMIKSLVLLALFLFALWQPLGEWTLRTHGDVAAG